MSKALKSCIDRGDNVLRRSKWLSSGPRHRNHGCLVTARASLTRYLTRSTGPIPADEANQPAVVELCSQTAVIRFSGSAFRPPGNPSLADTWS